MGNYNIVDFFLSCDSGYILNKMMPIKMKKSDQGYLVRIIEAVQEGLRMMKAEGN